MRLAVIGDTQHYRDPDGRLCALEPVVHQLDRWAHLFDEVVLCAPLDPGPPPVGFGPYSATNLRIEPLRRGGGNTLTAKAGLVTRIWPWFRTIRRVSSRVDAVHIRCPSNIGLVGLVATRSRVQHRHAMYAGVWQHYRGEPPFFALQRRMLANPRFGGPVSVYSGPDPRCPHLVPFFSPSFSLRVWEEATQSAQAKIAAIEARDTGDTGGTGARSSPVRLITVGRLTDNKNQRTAIQAVDHLISAGHAVTLDVLGDGPTRPDLESLTARLGIADRVRFHGAVDHASVLAGFATADIQLLPTRQEGYGKVLLEGMVFATVPVFAASPVAHEISGHGSRGVVVDPDDPAAMAEGVAGLTADPVRWASMAGDARGFAATVTLEAFEDQLRTMLEGSWGVALRSESDR